MDILDHRNYNVTYYPEKSSATIRFSPADHVIEALKKRFLQDNPGCKCQKWGEYERTIKSTAAPDKTVKAIIKRLAVILPEPDKYGHTYIVHALLPDILLPNFQHSVPNMAVLIYSGEIHRNANGEIDARTDDETGTRTDGRYDVFLSYICWLFAASEDWIDSNIDRFSKRPRKDEDREPANEKLRRMMSEKYREMVLSNLARNIKNYLGYIPKTEAGKSPNCLAIPENIPGMAEVGLPAPEEREKDGYFAPDMFNPDKNLMTESVLHRQLTESLAGGTTGRGTPGFAADSGITGSEGVLSSDFRIRMMDARQKIKGEAKAMPQSPKAEPRGIFRYLCDRLFLIGQYPAELLKCLMPATDSEKCFYSPGSFLRWLAETAQAAETVAARTVLS